jgi:predicted nucleic acid-binding protein
LKGFLLDTNFVSELVRIKPEPLVVDWMQASKEELLYLSVLTLGEIRKGIAGLPDGPRRVQLEFWLGTKIPERFAKRILTIDAAVADRWGALVAETKRNGTPMATVDALLAATALEHDLAVVTRNDSDFQKAHVPVVNPWEPE